jgi:UDPglucose 6-dehydrogenase
MRVAIVGLGVVGKAMRGLFPGAAVYDEPLGLGSREAVNECDVAFVCVPTPGTDEGPLDTSVVEEVLSWLETELVILRSTVNPGTTNRLSREYGKRIVFQPEYLGETAAHPLTEMKERGFMILGGDPADTRAVIEVYQGVYNASVHIRQVDSLTAELIKLAENRSIAHKVAEVQELFDLCEAAGVDYYVVREAVYQDDPRMSPYWTFIYAERRGFNSKCLPKDVYAISAYGREVGATLEITEAILQRNERYIRRKAMAAAVARGQ